MVPVQFGFTVAAMPNCRRPTLRDSGNIRDAGPSTHTSGPCRSLRRSPAAVPLLPQPHDTGSRLVFLRRKPIETCNIEHMRRRPEVRSFSRVCGDALIAGNRDQERDETSFTVLRTYLTISALHLCGRSSQPVGFSPNRREKRLSSSRTRTTSVTSQQRCTRWQLSWVE